MAKKKKPRLALIAADFNQAIVNDMIDAARQQAEEMNARVVSTIRVHGCYELPLLAQQILERGRVEGVVALGYIERGETLHGEVMGHVAHRALLDLSLQYQVPIGLGIIGPGATVEQAEARRIPNAKAAVSAIMRSLDALKEASAKK